jgi:ACS family tartrate transporter-like MFS transporter
MPLVEPRPFAPVSVASEAARSSDDSVGRSAVRKAGWRLLPLVALGYGTAYMDRANISYASLQMNHDLHFSATTYGFGAGLFFLSYAACEVPSNLLLCRFGARRWLARILLTWGILAIATMFVRTAPQFYIVRFLLGMAEAGFFPGVIFYLTQWFPPSMRARAMSRFYVSLPLSGVFMGAIAGALLSLNGRLGLAGWQWLFFVEGLPAVVLSAVFFFCLPDTPAHAKWLTPDESKWLTDQIQADAACAEHTHNIGRALLDPRVRLIGIVFFCMLSSGYAYVFTAPAMFLKLTGFSITNVGFLISVISIVSAAGMILNALHSDRTRERYWHVAIPFLILAAGYVIAGFSTLPWLVVPALAVASIAQISLQCPLFAIPPEFLKGKTMAAGIAAINTIGITGGFVGPYLMGLAKDATGSYQRGLLIFAAPALLAFAILIRMRHSALKQPAKIVPA